MAKLSPARWRDEAKSHAQGLWIIVRAQPSTLLLPALLFGLLCGVGVWAVTYGAHSSADSSKARAQSLAKDAAVEYCQLLSSAFSSTRVLADLVAREPQYDIAARIFNATASALMHQAPPYAVRSLLLVPSGVIRLVSPLTGNEAFVGLDLFDVPATKGNGFVDSVRAAVTEGQLSLEGPYRPLDDNENASSILIVRQAVFSPAADANETFGQPSTPSPGCGDPCGFNATTQLKFWGFVSAMVQLDALLTVIDGRRVSPPLRNLAQSNFRYLLTAPVVGVGGDFKSTGGDDGNDDSLMSSTAAPHPPGKGRTFVVEASAVPAGNCSVEEKLDLWNVQWTLRVCPSSGSWMPVWYGGVVALVVVLSLVAALALFGLLVSRRRKQMLLETLLPPALIKDLQAEHVEKTLAPLTLDNTDSPADLLYGLLGRLLAGDPPDLRDVVLLRTVLRRRMDVYRPLNLGGKIRGANLDADVAKALMLQLSDDPAVPCATVGSGVMWNEDGTAVYDKPVCDASRSSYSIGAAASCSVVTATAVRREQQLAAECKSMTGALSYIIWDLDAVFGTAPSRPRPSVYGSGRSDALQRQHQHQQEEGGPAEQQERGGGAEGEEEERAFGSALMCEVMRRTAASAVFTLPVHGSTSGTASRLSGSFVVPSTGRDDVPTGACAMAGTGTGTELGKVSVVQQQPTSSPGAKADAQASTGDGDGAEVSCSSPQGSSHLSPPHLKGVHGLPLQQLFHNRFQDKALHSQPHRHHHHHWLLPYRHECQPGPGGLSSSSRMRLGSGSGILLRLLGGNAGARAGDDDGGSGTGDAGGSARHGHSALSSSRWVPFAARAGLAASTAAGSSEGGGSVGCSSPRAPAAVGAPGRGAWLLSCSERKLTQMTSLTGRHRSLGILSKGDRPALYGSDPDSGADGSPMHAAPPAVVAAAQGSKRSSISEIGSVGGDGGGGGGSGGKLSLVGDAVRGFASSVAEAQVTCSPARPILEEVELLLAQSDGLQYDTWRLQQSSGGHALSCMGFYLLTRTGLVERFRLEPLRLARFLRTVEANYQANPYHNATHAADVLRTLHVLVHAARLTCHYLDPLGLLAAYFAAIVHDYGHPGLTNDFLVAAAHPLALRYNDRSPLESHHVGAVFTLMAERPELDVLAGLSRAEWTAFRKQVIEMVLATDMKQHFAILNHFTSVHQLTSNGGPASVAGAGTGTGAVAASGSGTAAASQSHPHPHQPQQQHLTQVPTEGPPDGAGKNRRASVRLGSGGLEPLPTPTAAAATAAPGGGEDVPEATASSSSRLPPPPPPVPLDESERLLSLQMVLKVADIGHLAAKLETHKRWLSALEEEFFRQGDRERELGLPISPLFDRAKQGVSKSQVGFFDFVVLPLLRAVTSAFPGAGPLLGCYLANYQYWRDVEGGGQQGQGQPPPAPSPSEASANPPQ